MDEWLTISIGTICGSSGSLRALLKVCQASGAGEYIVKPFDEAALKAKLEKLGRG